MPQTNDTKKKIILDLCGGTGSWARPYKEAGYEVITITLPDYDVTLHTTSGVIPNAIYFYSPTGKKDLHIPLKSIYGILAAPPCTMFSMARTVAKTPRDLKGAMEVVAACLRIVWKCQENGNRLAFWALENPKARLRWFLGKPAMTFNPFDFGDAYRKPTDIWGNFNTELKKNIVALDPKQDKQSRLNLQHLQPIPAEYVRDKNMSPRAIARSITHKGFAQAFYKANK